jgi:hypothetical protein
MVTSDTVIGNLALSAIGTRSTIVSLTENSAEAQTINLHYANVRDELLREAHWNFARKQIALALVNDSTQLSPPATTTSTFGSGVTSITVTSSAGILNGATVTGLGIASGTTVTSVTPGTVVLSAATTSVQTAASLTFTPNSYQPVPVPWVYEYLRPQDCVQVREILPLLPTQLINQSIFGIPNNGTVNGFGSLNTSPTVKYILSADLINGQNQQVILTNQPNAILVYTFAVTDPSFFDTDFVYAFAGRLAARISIALSGDKALTKMALEAANDLVNKAKARDGNEEIKTVNREADWIMARGFSWSYIYPSGPWGDTGVTTGYLR